MHIVENLPVWEAEFQSGWLGHYEKTGKIDWSLYNRPNNKNAPSGSSIDLSQSRLALISTAGGYLPASQAPFDQDNDLGDYSIRLFPSDTPFADIAYAHTHYDHTAINADPQVLMPLHHLADMVSEGVIGELASSVINFMGYQPDVGRVVKELIPAILDAAKAEAIDAALLVPA